MGRHVMIDLETLGTGPGSIILSIGAVEFWPNDPGREAERAFSRHISLEDSLRQGYRMEASTFLWWLQQSDNARAAIVAGQADAVPLERALVDLEEYVTTSNGLRGMGRRRDGAEGVWGHGAAFDLAFLEQAYARSRIQCPWHFSSQRDTRTLFALVSKKLHELGGEREGTYHDALDDARYQVRAVHAALALLGE